MKIISEVKCPNCNKVIQIVQVRRPYLKYIKGVRIRGKRKPSTYKKVKGVYITRLKTISDKEKDN